MTHDAPRLDPPDLQPPSAYPRTTGEFITVMSHFHRAEIARMAGWRDRIDRTTNWAITVVAATLSVALSTPTAHHGVLLFAMALIFLLLTIEARRYRFFDIFRARVRLLECDYFAQAFAPHPDHTTDWLQTLGADLRAPRFRTTFPDALGRRLRRNYLWLFIALGGAWALKTSWIRGANGPGPDHFAGSAGEWIDAMAIGLIPGPLVLLAVALFFAALILLCAKHRTRDEHLTKGSAHV